MAITEEDQADANLSEVEKRYRDALLGLDIMVALFEENTGGTEFQRLEQLSVIPELPDERLEGVLAFFKGNNDPESDRYWQFRALERLFEAEKLRRAQAKNQP